MKARRGLILILTMFALIFASIGCRFTAGQAPEALETTEARPRGHHLAAWASFWPDAQSAYKFPAKVLRELQRLPDLSP